MKADMISWLRQTGGFSAIKRFSSDQTQSQTSSVLQSLLQKKSANPAFSSGNNAAGTTVYGQSGKSNVVDAKGNRVDFASRYGAGNDNAVTINGEKNYVRGYNGGQKNNIFDITGNGNRLFAGQNASGNTMKINGGGNLAMFADGAADNKLDIKGDNVRVNFGMAGGSAANSGWNIQVATNNVEITISDGKAQVKVADEMKDKLAIKIDENSKTVSVTELT
jgi:hypothetical protein